MNRRDFIKFAGASSLIFPITQSISSQHQDLPDWKSYRLTYKINLPTTGKNARLWLPLPDKNDTHYQFTQGNLWNGNALKAEFTTIRNTNFPVFIAEWKNTGPKNVTVSSIVKTADHFVDLRSHATKNNSKFPPNINHFIKPSSQIPTKGMVYETANAIINKTKPQGTLEKARAIYNWVIDNKLDNNTEPNRNYGDTEDILLGSNYADINPSFVGLSRALGIPARLQYGIRIDESKLHEHLGKFGDITRSQHTRAEFYVQDLGWIPVDPADVYKVAQTDNLPPTHPTIDLLRKKLFGFWEMNWISFNYAEDIQLASNSIAGRLPFFMYPHAEIDGQIQNSLQPNEFSYQIISAELIGTGANFNQKSYK